MKYWIAILTTMMIAGACGYHQPIPDLTGNWIWVSTLTDAKPDSTNPSTPDNTGESQSIEFKGEHYTLINNGQLADSGTYRTAWKKNYNGDYVKMIYFQRAGNKEDSVEYFKKYDDTLLISYGFLGIDGESTTTYVLKRSQLQ